MTIVITSMVLSLILLLIVVAGMSIGVLMGRKPIKGSCGGMSSLGMETACDICGGDEQKCEKEKSKVSARSTPLEHDNTLAYNAAATGRSKHR